MGFKDNLEAQGRGAAQTLTGGWNDELVAKLIQAMPQKDDGTGIPREYAGGQYEQYRDQQRADEADSQRKAPGNFAFGQVAGALPATFATMATGGAPAVGLGVAQGAVSGSGLSTNTGKELAKDAVRGAAVGGGLAAAGNAAQAAAPAMKALWRQGPPSGGLQPALAAGARVPHVPEMPPPNVNMTKGGGGGGKVIDMTVERALRGDLAAAEEAFADGRITQKQLQQIEGGTHVSDEEVLKKAQQSKQQLEGGKVVPLQRPDDLESAAQALRTSGNRAQGMLDNLKYEPLPPISNEKFPPSPASKFELGLGKKDGLTRYSYDGHDLHSLPPEQLMQPMTDEELERILAGFGSGNPGNFSEVPR